MIKIDFKMNEKNYTLETNDKQQNYWTLILGDKKISIEIIQVEYSTDIIPETEKKGKFKSRNYTYAPVSDNGNFGEFQHYNIEQYHKLSYNEKIVVDVAVEILKKKTSRAWTNGLIEANFSKYNR